MAERIVDECMRRMHAAPGFDFGPDLGLELDMQEFEANHRLHQEPVLGESPRGGNAGGDGGRGADANVW
jgi:hypothetical protein